MGEDIQKGRGENIQKGSVFPPRNEQPQEEGCGSESDFRLPRHSPTALAAGVIWIGCGCLLLLQLVIHWVRVFSGDLHLGWGASWDFVDVLGGLLLTALLGVASGVCIFVGTRSVRGTIRNTLAYGFGSITLSLVVGTMVAVLLVHHEYLNGGIASLEAVMLLAAGILTLAGGRY
jgi:hypothetical protein